MKVYSVRNNCEITISQMDVFLVSSVCCAELSEWLRYCTSQQRVNSATITNTNTNRRPTRTLQCFFFVAARYVSARRSRSEFECGEVLLILTFPRISFFSLVLDSFSPFPLFLHRFSTHIISRLLAFTRLSEREFFARCECCSARGQKMCVCVCV